MGHILKYIGAMSGEPMEWEGRIGKSFSEVHWFRNRKMYLINRWNQDLNKV